MHDPAGARKVAADAIEEAARRKNDPAGLINIALERLVEGGYELPAFRTLNDMTWPSRSGSGSTRGSSRRCWPGSGMPARRGWSACSSRGLGQEQLEHQRWVDGLGDARAWWDGVPPSKIADFAGEAASADAAVMGDYTRAKQVALLAALMLTAQAKARDDTAEMFCRRGWPP